MHSFISTLTYKNLQNQNLQQFQYHLLAHILLTVSILSFLTATASVIGWLPSEKWYIWILYVYTLVMYILYHTRKEKILQYHRYTHILIFTSFFVLCVMTVSNTFDAFRLGWFFLLSFSAFILMGRGYGFIITMLIVIFVLLLSLFFDLAYSFYAIATFVVSLLAFALFTHYFLSKVQNDAIAFEEMVQIEVAKRQTQEQILLRKYRMTNMGEMIDAIAHQWRQPLAQANIYLLNMQEELDNNQYIKTKITALIDLNLHMSQTIDDFRHLLHDSKEKQAFDLHFAIKEACILMHNQLEKVDLHYTNESQYNIIGYKSELMQVLVILLSNAVEALENQKIQTPQIGITIETQGKHILLHIEDNARGISPSVAGRIFEPYVSSKKSTGGTGMGLYIAKIIVDDTMQGNLSVKQGIGGARFTLKIKREL